MELEDYPRGTRRDERTSVRHLLILGHPDQGSFNHAIAARYAEVARSNYQEVELRDLYAIGFDPLLKNLERPQLRPGVSGPDVRHEIDLVERSSVISFVYPLWFGSPPAIVKGYIDRVFGAAFQLSDLGHTRQVGPFVGKKLSLFTSSAGTGPWLDEMGIMTSLQQSFGHYLQSVFGFSSVYFSHADSVVDHMSPAVGEQHLFVAAEKARLICADSAAAKRQSGA